MTKNYTIQTILAGVGASASAFFGPWTDGLKWLIFFMCIDYFTGLISAFVSKTLRSDVGIKGVAKKVFYLLFVGVGFGISQLTGQAIIREAVIFAIIGNEVLSIAENAGKIGLPVPKPLLDAIDLWRNKNNG